MSDPAPKDRQTLRLFRQNAEPDLGSSEHLSLSAYISRHLEKAEQSVAEAKTQQPAPPASAFMFTGYRSTAEQPAGQRLDSLDVEMTAGLERYMPTPLFRLRVVKKRLDEEIEQLQLRINKYQRLIDTHPEHPTDDLRKRTVMLRERLSQLQAHEREVSYELQAYLASRGVFYQLLQVWRKGMASLEGALQTGIVTVRRWIVGSSRLEWEALNQELAALNEILQENMRSAHPASGEISQLVHQYEQSLRRMEKLAATEKRGIRRLGW